MLGFMSRSLELRLAELEKRLALLEREKKKRGKSIDPMNAALQDLGIAFLLPFELRQVPLR